MITTRTLQQWRRDALTKNTEFVNAISAGGPAAISYVDMGLKELNNRILRLTQELLDLNLLKKG